MSVLFIALFMFVGIGLLVLLLILLYTVVFHSGRQRAYRTSDMDQISYDDIRKPVDKQKVLIAFMIVAFSVGFLVMLRRDNQLNTEINHLSNEVSALNQSIWQASNRISSLQGQIYDLEKADDYVDRATYDIVGLNNELSGLVDITIYMNQMPSSGSMKLVIMDDLNEITEIELSTETTIIQQTLELDLAREYEISFVADTGENLIREEVMNLDMVRLMSRYKGISFDEDFTQDEIIFEFTIWNNYRFSELLAFEEVTIDVYLDEELVTAYLLTIPTSDSNDYQEFIQTLSFPHESFEHITIVVNCVDKLGQEYELFHEGW